MHLDFILILMVAALVFAFLAAILWAWIGGVRDRRAIQRCLRIHGHTAKNGVDNLL